MKGPMDRQTNKKRDRQKDRQTNRMTYLHLVSWTDWENAKQDRQIDRERDRQIERQTDGQRFADVSKHRQTERQMNEWASSLTDQK